MADTKTTVGSAGSAVNAGKTASAVKPSAVSTNYNLVEPRVKKLLQGDLSLFSSYLDEQAAYLAILSLCWKESSYDYNIKGLDVVFDQNKNRAYTGFRLPKPSSVGVKAVNGAKRFLHTSDDSIIIPKNYSVGLGLMQVMGWNHLRTKDVGVLVSGIEQVRNYCVAKKSQSAARAKIVDLIDDYGLLVSPGADPYALFYSRGIGKNGIEKGLDSGLISGMLMFLSKVMATGSLNGAIRAMLGKGKDVRLPINDAQYLSDIMVKMASLGKGTIPAGTYLAHNGNRYTETTITTASTGGGASSYNPCKAKASETSESKKA